MLYICGTFAVHTMFWPQNVLTTGHSGLAVLNVTNNYSLTALTAASTSFSLVFPPLSPWQRCLSRYLASRDCQSCQIARPCRDAQDRLLWKDKTCPARTCLIMSWKVNSWLLLSQRCFLATGTSHSWEYSSKQAEWWRGLHSAHGGSCKPVG